MMGIPKLLIRIVSAALLLALVIAGLVFWFRPPVVIVTVPSFDLLYGASRARIRELALSAALFRRVTAVRVSEGAGPEIVAAAINQVSTSPRAVLFPSLFGAAARRYQEAAPETPVIFVEGRREASARGVVVQRAGADSGEGPLVVRADLEADLFRAGICAAGLAGEGVVMVLQDQTLGTAARAAFKQGLETQGFQGNPVYLAAGADYQAWQDVSCAVILGSAPRFFEQNLKIPAVLFSWIDPQMTPDTVKVIFDDSPWALVERALKMTEGGSLPSELIVIRNRIPRENSDLWELVRKSDFIGQNRENL